MNQLLLGSLLSLLLMQSSAFAYDFNDDSDDGSEIINKIYLGASVGVQAVGDAADLCSDLDLNCVSMKAYLGYRATPNVAFEGGYHNLFSDRSPVTGNKLEATGFSLAVLGLMPVKDNIEAFGKLGYAAWQARVDGRAASDGTDLLMGAGAQMRFTDNLGLRGEVEYIGGDLDSTNMNAGITYSTW